MKNRISFECALDKLEEIVRRLEEGKETLSGTVKLYHEGTELIKMCKDELNQAEGEIEVLDKEFNVGDNE